MTENLLAVSLGFDPCGRKKTDSRFRFRIDALENQRTWFYNFGMKLFLICPRDECTGAVEASIASNFADRSIRLPDRNSSVEVLAANRFQTSVDISRLLNFTGGESGSSDMVVEIKKILRI